LGDLYVVRVGGNVVDAAVLGSIELAVQKFDIRLIVVMGHGHCSAVETAIQGQANGHLIGLMNALRPAIEKVKDEPGDLLDNAIRANARLMAEQLRRDDPMMADRFEAGQLKIVAAYYDGVTGEVEILA
jgi:carbonic anhydrase